MRSTVLFNAKEPKKGAFREESTVLLMHESYD